MNTGYLFEAILNNRNYRVFNFSINICNWSEIYWNLNSIRLRLYGLSRINFKAYKKDFCIRFLHGLKEEYYEVYIHIFISASVSKISRSIFMLF